MSVSEQGDHLFVGAWMGDLKEGPPQVTAQAGLAAASGSVDDEYAEVPDLNWWPDGTEGSDES